MSVRFVSSTLLRRHVVERNRVTTDIVTTIWACNTLVSVGSFLCDNTTFALAFSVVIWGSSGTAANTHQPENRTEQCECTGQPCDGEHASSNAGLDVEWLQAIVDGARENDV